MTAATGDRLTVFVSDSYSPDQVQRWADFFSRLPHGSELSVYVAPLDEIAPLCGDDALGCYGDDHLATIDDAVGSVPAEDVAAHEYGHHVAFNRSNTPWLAVDWGPKHWASYANICARTVSGTVFPGNEASSYRLNPGEAFAEAYRVLAEKQAGATTFVWSLVDGSFYPDGTGLAAVEQDVGQPWTTPVSANVAARFRAHGPKTWSRVIPTPLDGIFDLTFSMPAGALYDATVLSGDGRTVLAKSLWSGLGTKTATFQICGTRSLLVRVTRRGSAGRFHLKVTHP